MKKFKLIKEYPGSPKFGTEIGKTLKSYKNYSYSEEGWQFGVLKEHVEDNPEYWEEIKDIVLWVVYESICGFFLAWKPYSIDYTPTHGSTFKTKIEAEEFILKYKPCLSLTEVQCIIGASDYYDILIDYIKKNKL
jgi:hypothetical protein